MAEITNLRATTELEAVNAMLSAIGESPVTALGTGHADEETALEILRTSARELCETSWKFNTEYDVRLCPDDTEVWTDPDTSENITLNVFYVPDDLAAFRISQIPDQQGQNHVDFVARISTTYEDPDTLAPRLVFYDRDYNRDGFPQDERSNLWINPIWYLDFNHMPGTARRYLTTKAARRFAAQVVGSTKQVRFSAEDETTAYRLFLKEQSPDDKGNVLDHPDRRKVHGGRPRRVGPLSHRKNERW